MDMTLLSRMIRELVLVNDEVGLPGLGTFTAELMPASFSDKGFTINPPYRRLSFRQGDTKCTLLPELYARSNNIEQKTAEVIIAKTVAELAETVKSRKAVVLPGLGRLRATSENNLFFVPEEGLDLWPDGEGLEAVSLKSHVETREEIASAVGSLAAELGVGSEAGAKGVGTTTASVSDGMTERAGGGRSGANYAGMTGAGSGRPGASGAGESAVGSTDRTTAAGAGVSETAGASGAKESAGGPTDRTTAAGAGASEATGASGATAAGTGAAGSAETLEANAGTTAPSSPRHRKLRFLWWLIPLILVALAAVALGVFLLLCQTNPEFIDSLLYTPEELRIINY